MAKSPSQRKHPGKGTIQLVNPKATGATQIDFASQKGSSRVVEGTYADLIRDGHGCSLPWVANMHADPKQNRAAFLVGRGWSATPEKRKAIAAAGIPVMAINDYPVDAPKPQYWCSGDPPRYFRESIWADTEVLKFTGIHNRDGERPRDGAYAPKRLVREAPNTWFFHQATDECDVESWLFHPFISWGSTMGCVGGPKPLYEHGAARSSMLIGLKLLFFLGYRRVYLCGADCESHHHPSAAYWPAIFHILSNIAPYFKRWGYRVYQTSRDSHLRCFDFTTFEEAIRAGN